MLRENVTSRRQQIITLREVGKNLFGKKIVKLNSPPLLAACPALQHQRQRVIEGFGEGREGHQNYFDLNYFWRKSISDSWTISVISWRGIEGGREDGEKVFLSPWHVSCSQLTPSEAVHRHGQLATNAKSNKVSIRQTTFLQRVGTRWEREGGEGRAEKEWISSGDGNNRHSTAQH